MINKIIIFILCLFFIGCGNQFYDNDGEPMRIFEKHGLFSKPKCIYSFKNEKYFGYYWITAPCDFANVNDYVKIEIIKVEGEEI